MNFIKKINLRIGAIFLVAISIVPIVACSNNSDPLLQKIKDDVQKVIDKIVNQKASTKIDPRKIRKGVVTPTDLKIQGVGETLGCTIAYTNLAVDFEKGVVVVEVTVKKESITKQKIITISGYLTKAENDENIIDDIMNKLPSEVKTTFNNRLPRVNLIII